MVEISEDFKTIVVGTGQETYKLMTLDKSTSILGNQFT